jgi:Tfp pilus assembly protein FimT
MGVSQKKERAIMAMLTAPTMKQAADQAKIGETTLFRWLKTPDFQQDYRKARRQALDQTISRLQQATTHAVNTLQDVMVDELAPHSSRVSAAKAILDISFKAFELDDLGARIESLERQLESRR